MSNNLEDIAAFASVLTRYAADDAGRPGPGHVGRIAVEVWRDAASLHTLAEKECNGEMTPRDEKRQKRIEERVETALKQFGAVAIQFNGDPRGSAVKVKFKGGETYGDWGGEGLWCL